MNRYKLAWLISITGMAITLIGVFSPSSFTAIALMLGGLGTAYCGYRLFVKIFTSGVI